MDELAGSVWVETSRWIKYEEEVEGRGEWGRPHVASLSFHSLMDLRRCLQQDTLLLLDAQAADLASLLHRLVEALVEEGVVGEEQRSKVLEVLLYRHQHVHPHRSAPPWRHQSQRRVRARGDAETPAEDAMVTDFTVSSPIISRAPTQAQDRAEDGDRKEAILACMEEGAEGAVVLVGALGNLSRPLTAFVRLAEAVRMPNTIEVSPAWPLHGPR